jgi:anaphase-promoting complex subunit 2
MSKLASRRNRRVFDSVFGPGNISQPTPVATPAGGFPAQGQKWGGPDEQHRPLKSSVVSEQVQPILTDTRDIEDKENHASIESRHIQDQVRWDRSWHIVTHALVLPPFPKGHTATVPLQPQITRLESTFYRALEDILDPATHIPYASHTEDIVVWHTQQVRSHFLNQVRPVITHLKKSSDQPDELISESLAVLKSAHIQYLHGFKLIKDQLDATVPDVSAVVLIKFQRDLRAVISNSVSDTLSDPLRRVVAAYVTMILGLPMNQATEKIEIQPESRSSERARLELLELVRSLKKVGLAGEKFQVTFAEIMHTMMKDYVQKGFKGVWSLENSQKTPAQNFLDPEDSVLPRAAHLVSPSQCTSDLCEWVENRYSKLAVQVLSMVDTPTTITWANKEKYKEMGIGHLADLRIRELFDIVINYPHGGGALEDLRTAITTPQRRLYLTEAFAKTLNERLLHPGTSTLQILQTYISMIWSFHSLDHSKVLLDRVAYPLQVYLCSRDDTVRIIIAGLLADPDDTHSKGGGADKLVELAQILHNENQQVEYQSNTDGELDWHDMDWVPDPVDAGPGYKRSKNADIIGTLIGALGSSDIFIKEFQNIIGDHLLKNEGGFEREVCNFLGSSVSRSVPFFFNRGCRRSAKWNRACLRDIMIIRSIPFTYDHRLRRIGHPVRSAIHKPQIGRLVVGWVTTSEYLLLYVFVIFTT